MNAIEKLSGLFKPLLEQHSYLSVEYLQDSFRTKMENRNPNVLGNFAGGDMAYIANASAGLQCLAEGTVAQTASINIECLARGDGESLIADSQLVHKGQKLIRIRCNVYVRKNGDEKLVAVAQINMSPMSDQNAVIDLLIEN